MKKAKKASTKTSKSRKARAHKTAAIKARGARKSPRVQRKAAPRRSVRAEKASSAAPAGSAATLAAGVLSRRAAKVEKLARSAAAAKPVVKKIPPPALSRSAGKAARAAHARQARPHGAAGLPGNRPLVKVSRVPQYNYMRAPGADSGFDVGDTVEVFCDHDEEGERVRGWIKGVVVQVDNKLVAVQFRSNVFLTDGWMVPDRILWYSLGSDQIRGTGMSKKNARAAIPEY